jgi:LacI family transcriptional regulator
MAGSVSIKDIALRAGVSPATVSRVVNGKNYVKRDKRERILKVIEETGFVPNKAARDMVMDRSYTVGIVIPETFNMFQRQLLSLIERRLETFGYHTMFFFLKFNGGGESELVARLKGEKLDGLIMIHEVLDDNFYDYTLSHKIPVVATTFKREGASSVHVEEEDAAIAAVNHLISLGHRKIDMITGAGFSFGKERALGYYKALDAAGIEKDESRLIATIDYRAEFGLYAMRELLLRSRDFSAVFAATDELAMGAIRALNDAGLKVPQDVSVVGFDNIEIAGYYVPRLTTIAQPLDAMAEQTALLLHRKISGEQNELVDRILPHQLIIRESTARVN